MRTPNHGTLGSPTTPPRPRPDIQESDLRGFKYFEHLRQLVQHLHPVGTARDKAGNRELFFDDYVLLLLLYFFNPVITSLRGLCQASDLAKVQKILGVKHTSLGSLHEAGTLFEPALLRAIVQELAVRASTTETNLNEQQREALHGLTAVDGTFLQALPRMMWALWRQDKHAVKMHLQFDVLKGVPADATITPGANRETDELSAMLQAERLYVVDRGYGKYRLYRNILDAHSSFIARVKDNTAFVLAAERPLSDEARAAGVTRDVVLSKLGAAHHRDYIGRPLRLVMVDAHSPNGTPYSLWLLTDRMDLDAELVALAYRYRWSVELFFRWFKCILGCRHLIAESENGVALQCYVALIASLLISLWTGLRPTKRTWEMIQFYLQGWASLEDLERHLEKRRAKENPAANPATATL